MNIAVFGKTMENLRKHRGIKLATTERRRNYLISESSHHTTKFFISNRNEKNKNAYEQTCPFRTFSTKTK